MVMSLSKLPNFKRSKTNGFSAQIVKEPPNNFILLIFSANIPNKLAVISDSFLEMQNYFSLPQID